MRFDATGKVSLDHIYTQPDPRPYFTALRPLGYTVPQHAKPYFAKLVREYRDTHGVAVPQVLDIGCSYGINAALLKQDTTMEALYEHYAPGGEDRRTRAELLAEDRARARTRRPAPVRVVGLDTSAEALSYAVRAGHLDDAVHADLEQEEPTAAQRELLAGTDLVVSTGCLGYVTERTLTRVVAAQGGRRPWMAHFVLRMFPFDPIARALAELGYRTTRVEGLFPQRRFASPQEQDRVLAGMAAAGVPPGDLEADGWFAAQLFLSRPDEPKRERP
ncbi:class I SAM-dependent methyltransferase [Streptomyces sp. GSL17-111]|uniref:class I SAM-dependent methyltransferase n=1 Tax=Streptomyces sp. GSL17-111 TaxID=3121596 RepID=UPI0030F3831C